MTQNAEDLGKPVAWQIRDMPEAIRDAVTEQARVEGVKVPDLLTRLVLDARDNGWTFKGSQNRFANPSNTADPLADLIRLAREATPDGKDSAAMQEARRVVLDRLRPLRGPMVPLLRLDGMKPDPSGEAAPDRQP
jgi:hypothetical protein